MILVFCLKLVFVHEKIFSTNSYMEFTNKTVDQPTMHTL